MRKVMKRLVPIMSLMLVLSFVFFAGEVKAAKKPARVTGLTLNPGVGKVNVSWTPVKWSNGYELYFRQANKGAFKLYKMQTQTMVIAKRKLKAGASYQFKVRAMKKVGKNRYIKGPFSTVKKCKILKTTKTITGLYFDMDDNGTYLKLKWDKFKGAPFYVVSYQEEGTDTWNDLPEVKGTTCSLKSLYPAKTYKIYISTNGGLNKSATLTVKPAAYIKENKDRILSEKVKSISYKGNKAIYVNKNYTQAIKEAYVNYRGFSSKTKYFIWASLYTQQATIYKGSRGKWKMIRTFDIASGAPKGHSPMGNFTIFKKEKMWASSKVLWVNHYYKKASFHSILLYRNNKVKDGRLGKPISRGCIRCPILDAKFIYKSVPIGTGVRVF